MRGSLDTGADAARMGLVNYAASPGEVLEKARGIAQELADGPP
jgi:enoyl-CoA hydratase/carnithine racemase